MTNKKIRFEIDGQMVVKTVPFIKEFKNEETGEVISVEEFCASKGAEGYTHARTKTDPATGEVRYLFYTEQWINEHQPIEVDDNLTPV